MLNQKTLLYYDGNCGFCFKVAKFLKRICGSRIEIINSINNKIIAREMFVENSWIVVNNGTHYYRYDAFLNILSNSKFRFLTKILSLRPFKFLGDKIYKKVASNRLRICT